MRAGERSVSWMCLSVRRTATNGGKTARMTTPARITGTRDGTGPQVKNTHVHAHRSVGAHGLTHIIVYYCV